jgi:thioredoxin 1
MIERLAITAIILIGLGGLTLGWRWYKWRLTQAIKPIEPGHGVPTLLWFTADYCLPCKARQAPIIDHLAEKLGRAILVRRIDVSESPDLARHYKVMTLPTTVVLNKAGQVTHINYGLAGEAKLEGQLV